MNNTDFSVMVINLNGDCSARISANGVQPTTANDKTYWGDVLLYCPVVFGHFSPAPVKTDRAVRIQ